MVIFALLKTLLKGCHKYLIMKDKRPLCNRCQQRPCAINYYDNDGNVHYRTKCDPCATKKKPSLNPKWRKSGYRKKKVCDKCGFRSVHNEQIVVFHIDGNLNNTVISKLRSVCLNCIIEVQKEDSLWRQGDLIADF